MLINLKLSAFGHIKKTLCKKILPHMTQNMNDLEDVDNPPSSVRLIELWSLLLKFQV